MEHTIIVDSCCDLTPQLAEELGVKSVPLIMRLGRDEYVDDESLDLPGFMSKMKACVEKVGSASPSPLHYMEAMIAAGRSFVVTLSSKLSGSFASAELGKAYAAENGASDVHIFDSKSASAGELLIAIKIRELITNGIDKEQIIKTISGFIDNMKTYFVLERYDNLLKNGRLSKISGKLISILNIKLIMGADSDGNIALYEKPRGTSQMLERLLALIKNSGKQTSGEIMVISHCNNLPLAQQLSNAFSKRFNFKNIVIVPTRGISSLYADDKGVVLAF